MSGVWDALAKSDVGLIVEFGIETNGARGGNETRKLALPPPPPSRGFKAAQISKYTAILGQGIPRE